MSEWLVKLFQKLGVSYEIADIGTHQMAGKTLKLPPILLGTYGNDPKKKTILVYGHYDVQPALIEDGWDSDPWKLTTDSNGRMVGRGSSDDKGPIIGWLNAIEAHQKAGIEFPVNLKICFEGMEESGSENLDELIAKEAKRYFKDVDAVCISDNYWLGVTKPCLTYGLRGICYFELIVSGPGRDLHSGVFGGTVYEPMTDLVYLLSKLVKPNGEILIPGILDDVAALTGAFSASGAKTVIPCSVRGKFSIRLVPDMDPERVKNLAEDYLRKEFEKLGTKNQFKLETLHGAKAWVASPNHWNFVAASKAVESVYNCRPDFTREGGSIPVTLTFQDLLGKNVLLLPMGRGDDGAHSTNEKLDLSNYIQGIKLLGAYLHEVSAIKTD
ncbi:16021_t:CDS:2 [Entrophospora sp. SA101]|nr:13508_t:CDS:2 [Entrophospora sp. SA101]CAJ0625313.1 16021_t:CDS:2 [Entrophospora sp. SA101]CAJ0827571.1 17342_t:CDS:2 [Entrophospora sp. SA101]CAJ0833851.1 8995_t:CDS:2 [Entrophospora sp. SA101]CAJ0835279.1 1701_t:CDS:2 [Entrophospora sp. SA101]